MLSFTFDYRSSLLQPCCNTGSMEERVSPVTFQVCLRHQPTSAVSLVNLASVYAQMLWPFAALKNPFQVTWRTLLAVKLFVSPLFGSEIMES